MIAAALARQRRALPDGARLGGDGRLISLLLLSLFRLIDVIDVIDVVYLSPYLVILLVLLDLSPPLRFSWGPRALGSTSTRSRNKQSASVARPSPGAVVSAETQRSASSAELQMSSMHLPGVLRFYCRFN